jgi:hypothetical protein
MSVVGFKILYCFLFIDLYGSTTLILPSIILIHVGCYGMCLPIRNRLKACSDNTLSTMKGLFIPSKFKRISHEHMSVIMTIELSILTKHVTLFPFYVRTRTITST